MMSGTSSAQRIMAAVSLPEFYATSLRPRVRA